MLLRDFFNSHYLPIRLIGGSENTVEQYGNAVNRFAVYLDREPTLDDLDDGTLAAVAQWIVADRRSPATANKWLRHMTALARLAHKKGFRASLPEVGKLPEPDECPAAWTVDHVSQLLAAAKYRRGEIAGVDAAIWWRGVILFAYDTGARIGAIMRCKTENVDLERRTALLRGETQKKRRFQLCTFSRDTAEALVPIRQARLLLFGLDYDDDRRRRSLFARFRRLVVAAKLDPTEGLFHRLRRTRATYGEIVAPGSATADLGHSSRSVTVRSYIDARLLPPSNVVDSLPRP